MTLNDVDLDILEALIHEAGRPVHVNVLTRAAIRAWLSAGEEGRRYAPGAQYQVGETVLFEGQRAAVESVREGSNPVQGPFAVLTLVLPGGTERLMAARVPGAPAEDREPVTEARVAEALRAQGGAARQAVQAALTADPRFVSCQALQGGLWCLAEILPQVQPKDLRAAVAVLPDALADGEPTTRTTEELVRAAWAMADDGSDDYALHAFALGQALSGCADVCCLGDCWTSARAWDAFTARPVLETPRVASQVTLPEGIEEAAQAQVEQEQRREAMGEDDESGGGEPDEEDLEAWRQDRPTHAVFTLRARHYYEGWLPLSGQVRRLFPPLAAGRQEVVFHHHFGDVPAAFRAFVDQDVGRIWVSPQMYETLRCQCTYPGARLRLSARNERAYDLAQREPSKTDPIHIWRMWLDEDGRIKYEDFEEPRRYDVDDDVYVAETVRTFDPPQDWTRTGAALLRVMVHGKAGNATDGRMYLTLSDGPTSSMFFTRVTWRRWPGPIGSIGGSRSMTSTALT